METNLPRPVYGFAKRVADVLISSAALLLLLPLFLPLALLLRLTGEGEVLYLQDRVGFGGRTFKLMKFATMLKNSPNIGTRTITTRNDPRVLPFGRCLRKTKINELPQILNVLKGDMSIVGPRPLTRETFSMYSEEVRRVVARNVPGLTGIGSVVFRDEEALLNAGRRSVHDVMRTEIAPFKGALEMWYDRRKSPFVDIAITALTMLAILWPGNQMHNRVIRGLPRRGVPAHCGSPGVGVGPDELAAQARTMF
jgi:lipopolysaccharide/colanic/teichoic acid biosynthesis glycosyltransferase